MPFKDSVDYRKACKIPLHALVATIEVSSAEREYTADCDTVDMFGNHIISEVFFCSLLQRRGPSDMILLDIIYSFIDRTV